MALSKAEANPIEQLTTNSIKPMLKKTIDKTKPAIAYFLPALLLSFANFIPKIEKIKPKIANEKDKQKPIIALMFIT